MNKLKRSNHNKILLSLLILFGSYNLFAQHEKIDSLIKGLNVEGNPGGAISIVYDSSHIVKTYGCANTEYNIPMDENSVFNMASLSKHVTAFCILLLEDQGRISLDDDIRMYISDFPEYANPIKIKHLIYHTSGIRDPWGLLHVIGWNNSDVLRNEQFLRLIKKQRDLNFKPGERFLYSSSNYTILAEIISNITGVPFKNWVKENVFIPLGMNKTFFNDDVCNTQVRNRASSYLKIADNSYLNSQFGYSLVGTGGLYSTPKDLSKWINNFFQFRVGNKNILERLFDTGYLNDGTKLNYAAGLYKNETVDKTIFYTHDGNIGGFRSYLSIFPSKKFGVIAVGNVNNFKASQIVANVTELYFPDIWQSKNEDILKEKKPIAYSDEWVKYTGNYLVQKMNAIGEILIEDSTVYIKAKQIGKRELIYNSGHMFNVKAVNSTITFFENSFGVFDKFEINSSGRKYTAIRSEMSDQKNVLSDDDIKDYCGTYYCEDLETILKIEFVDNRFVAKHLKYDENLKLVSKDFFEGISGNFSAINFIRDDAKISGFNLTGYRVLNLYFKKININ